MSGLRDKIYEMHGKVSSLETSFESIEKKLDTVIVASTNPDRRCNRLQKIELVGIIAIILLLVSLVLNPATKTLAEILKVVF